MLQKRLLNSEKTKEFADLLFQATIPFSVSYEHTEEEVKISHCLTAKLVYTVFTFDLDKRICREHMSQILSYKEV